MYIIHEVIDSRFQYNAGSKARNDVEEIICSQGGKVFKISNAAIPDRRNLGLIKKIVLHKTAVDEWLKQIKHIEANSVIFIQFPVFLHTVLFKNVIRFLHKKNCYVVAIIHDMETLRNAKKKHSADSGISKRYILEEKLALPHFDLVVAHNDKMRQLIVDMIGIKPDKVITISIFDYLIPDYEYDKSEKQETEAFSVIIAGNLLKEKAGYIYKLPKGTHFELYGSNYEGVSTDEIHYNGSFLPEELPYHLKGDFGLVWDGPSDVSCVGAYGEYLKYNNPHKTSLYLACGLPVLIWKEAAMAEFIQNNHCGILIESLSDLPDVLRSISADEYRDLKKNAMTVGDKLRKGLYTNEIIRIAMNQ